MIRWLVLFALMLVPAGAGAQTGPRLTVELPQGKVIVGQPLSLQMKLLVPSWMPRPPVWPTLEVPSLLVRLPERASTPVSETVGGETWSGISRTYQLYPLEVGAYEIPAQTLIVTYADPGNPDPIIAELTLAPIRFDAVLPKGAGGLDPPIVASGLTLEQRIDGGPDLMTGDAVTRVVTVRIDGTTPILLPALLPDLPPGPDPAPLRAYAREPVVTETEDRGALSGSRSETTTYVAQSGGGIDLAPVTLDWFNLQTGKVETLGLDGISLVITAPPPPPPGPADYGRWLAVGLGGLGLVWMIGRLVGPRLRRMRNRALAIWQASELHAHARVLRAIRARDLHETSLALRDWAGFFDATQVPGPARLLQELARIGAARYGRGGAPEEKAIWRAARRNYRDLRATLRNRRKAGGDGNALPALNPGG